MSLSLPHNASDTADGMKMSGQKNPAARPLGLFAITPEVRQLFLNSSGMPWDTLAIDVRWFDPSSQTAETWQATLIELNPEIIISGWGTPLIPEAWMRQPDCRLRYVCHLAGSVRTVVSREFLVRGGVVSNWGGIAAASVAEHALLLILAALRNLGSWREHISTPFTQRRTKPFTRPLHARRVGLHGFGRIAQAIVPLLRPFGVSIRAFSEGVPADVFRTHGVEICDSLEALFKQSDVLVECEALTEKTEGIITAELLNLLPADAVFVNVGRGRIVDENALVEAAAKCRLRVAVDVVSNEPIQDDHIFLHVPQLIVSPHIGGPTVEEYGLCGRQAWDNLNRYLQNEPPDEDTLVSLKIYDRST